MRKGIKNKVIACFGAAALTALIAGGSYAAKMGAKGEPIKLAINEWTGQHVTTRIAGEMLKAAGYDVKYVTAVT